MHIPENVMVRLKELSCEEVAKDFGLQVSNHKAHCFMHDDKHPSLAFKGNYWRCFSCDKGGDAISLIQEMCNCSFQEACQLLCEKYGISLSTTWTCMHKDRLRIFRNQSKQKVPIYRKNVSFNSEVGEVIIDFLTLGDKGKSFLFDERFLDPLIIKEVNIKSLESSKPLLDFLLTRFDKDILMDCKILNGRHLLNIDLPSLLIPYYDINKKLVALQSRYLGEKEDVPRFKFLCNSSPVLFNTFILSKMNKGDRLFIMEGITDCFSMLSSGMCSIAIPSASSVPDDDLKLLLDYSLFMIPDNDEAGHRAFYKLFQKFYRYRKLLTRIELPDNYKDFSEYYVDNKNKM